MAFEIESLVIGTSISGNALKGLKEINKEFEAAKNEAKELADTIRKELEESLEDAAGASVDLNKEMAKVNDALVEVSKSTEDLKGDFDSVADVMAEAERAAADMGRRFKTSSNEADDAAEAFKDAAGASVDLNKEMAKVNDALVEVSKSTEDLKGDFDSVADVMAEAERAAADMGRRFKTSSNEADDAAEAFKDAAGELDDFNEVADEGTDSAEKWSESISVGKVNLGELKGALQGGVSGLTEYASSLGLSTKAVLAAAVAATAFVTALAAVNSALEVAFETADEIQELSKLTRSLGITEEALSRLVFAGEQYALSQDVVIGGVKDLRKNLAEFAASGSGPAAESFKLLNLSIADFQGLEPDKQVEVLADAVSKADSESEALRATLLLMGEEAGGSLFPVLREGSETLRELGDEAEFLGATIGEDGVTAVEEFNKSNSRLNAVTGELKTALTVTVLGGLKPFVDAIREVLVENREVIKSGLEFAEVFGKTIVNGLRPLGNILTRGVGVGLGVVERSLRVLNPIMEFTLSVVEGLAFAFDAAASTLDEFGNLVSDIAGGELLGLSRDIDKVTQATREQARAQKEVNGLLSERDVQIRESELIDAVSIAAEAEGGDPELARQLLRSRLSGAGQTEAQQQESLRRERSRAQRRLLDAADSLEREAAILAAEGIEDPGLRASAETEISRLRLQAESLGSLEDGESFEERRKRLERQISQEQQLLEAQLRNIERTGREADSERASADAQRRRDQIRQQAQTDVGGIPGAELIQLIIAAQGETERDRLRSRVDPNTGLQALTEAEIQERLLGFATGRRQELEEILNSAGGARRLQTIAQNRGVVEPEGEQRLDEQLAAALQAETGVDFAQLSSSVLPITSVRPTILVSQVENNFQVENTVNFESSNDPQQNATLIGQTVEETIRSMVRSASEQVQPVLER